MRKPYARIADRIAAKIAGGDLAVGARLPPQRAFAYEEGIAVSTASRVYEELRRRGLVAGEVGRGTYVTQRFTPLDPALQEPSGANVDLDIVFRLDAASRQTIAASTQRFFKNGMDSTTAGPASVVGDQSARRALASLSGSASYPIDPEKVVIAGSGKEALAASLSMLASRGHRIGVESLTYPFVISVARMLGIDLVPLALDDQGVTPDALGLAAEQGLDGVYLQPTLHSPLVLTMSQTRRLAIADILIRYDIPAIEDRVYAFMRPGKPLAAHAPEHVLQIDSLSKRLMPGLSIGWITAPSRFRESLANALRTGGWMAPSVATQLAVHWIRDGVVNSVQTAKRAEASAMYTVAMKAFSGLDVRCARDALHAWLTLPGGWRGEEFASASARLGIAVAAGRDFAVQPGNAPAGVRIALSAKDLTTWEFAVREIADIVRRKKAP